MELWERYVVTPSPILDDARTLAKPAGPSFLVVVNFGTDFSFAVSPSGNLVQTCLLISYTTVSQFVISKLPEQRTNEIVWYLRRMLSLSVALAFGSESRGIYH